MDVWAVLEVSIDLNVSTTCDQTPTHQLVNPLRLAFLDCGHAHDFIDIFTLNETKMDTSRDFNTSISRMVTNRRSSFILTVWFRSMRLHQSQDLHCCSVAPLIWSVVNTQI